LWRHKSGDGENQRHRQQPSNHVAWRMAEKWHVNDIISESNRRNAWRSNNSANVFWRARSDKRKA